MLMASPTVIVPVVGGNSVAAGMAVGREMKYRKCASIKERYPDVAEGLAMLEAIKSDYLVLLALGFEALPLPPEAFNSPSSQTAKPSHSRV